MQVLSQRCAIAGGVAGVLAVALSAGPMASAVPPRRAQATTVRSVTSKAKPKCTGEQRPGRLVVVRGMPTATRTTARALLVGGVRCDAASLTKRAQHDKTRLSFGIVTPKDFFALGEKEVRYRYLVDALVKARPGYEKISHSYVWPRVAAGEAYQERAAWDEAVAAGLLTKAQADQMRRQDSGYLGWRISVSERGTWEFFIAGD